MRLFSLDRMGDVTLQKEKFKMDKNFDAIAYFSESYGVMVDHRIDTERIVLAVWPPEPYYPPLHGLQREIRTTDEYCDFELRLKPTSEFHGVFLQRAEWIEVLEPQSLIDDIIAPAPALHQSLQEITSLSTTPLIVFTTDDDTTEDWPKDSE